jgi:hypothetical protein
LEDNIKMDLGEIFLDNVDWIYLSQDRKQGRSSVETEAKFLVPYNVENSLNG